MVGHDEPVALMGRGNAPTPTAHGRPALPTNDPSSATAPAAQGGVGMWVDRGGVREDKIAAICVRVRHWVTFHGISLNVEPDLGHYQGIVPCGIEDQGVTSLVDLGIPVTMAEVDTVLRQTFVDVFETAVAPGPVTRTGVDQAVGR